MKQSPIILLLFLVIGWLTSCEKEVFDVSPTMEAYYVESVNLPSASLDSVTVFKNKVNGYVTTYPEAKEYNKYPLIINNIKNASFRLSITINDEWNGEKHINY